MYRDRADIISNGWVVVEGSGQVPGTDCESTFVPICRIQRMYMVFVEEAELNGTSGNLMCRQHFSTRLWGRRYLSRWIRATRRKVQLREFLSYSSSSVHSTDCGNHLLTGEQLSKTTSKRSDSHNYFPILASTSPSKTTIRLASSAITSLPLSETETASPCPIDWITH